MPTPHEGSWREVFSVFLRLGLTSFGGPVAHIGYFRDTFVVRRRWLDERAYADIVALCQFLPGPASSQVGLSIGLSRAGLPGALAAWTGFTLPSAILMAAFAYGVAATEGVFGAGWLHALKVAAVAVVAQAVWGMARSLCPDRERATIAVAAALIVVAFGGSLAQVAVILGSAVVGRLFLSPVQDGRPGEAGLPLVPVGRTTAIACLAVFALLLAGLPLLASGADLPGLAQLDAFYRAGALVFGGGHVVLPLLQASVVEPGWVGRDAFLAGYGMAQAVPGPLLTFSAYLGAAMEPAAGSGIVGGAAGAALCLVAIFLPSFLLVVGVLPFWDRLRRHRAVQSALLGVNAGVVGLLVAALYDPVWTAGIRTTADFALGLAAFLLLTAWKVPAWGIVLLCAGLGAASDLLGLALF